MSTSIDIINARRRRLERQKNAKDSIHVLHAIGVLTDKDAQTKLNELNEEGIIGFTIIISGVKYNINGMSPSIDLDNIILPDGLGVYNGSARHGIICIEDAINESEESFSSWDEFGTKIKSLLPEPTRCVVM